MIDASNAVTIGLYNAILDESDEEIIPGGGTREAVGGLSVAYMKVLDLNSLYSSATFSSVAGAAQAGITSFVGQILGSVLFVITAFVFFAVALLFIIRYITLLVLLMLSPIAFMGMALPAIKTYSNQWWDSLRGQLIFPPVFMLMTWVVLTLISSMFEPSDGESVGMGTEGLLSLMFNFAIIIGLAIFTLITAKKTASEGSSMIGQAGGMLNKFAGGALIGSGAAVMRRTVGARAQRDSENEELKKRAASGDKKAQARLATSRKLAGATFDMRSSFVGQKISKATGVDLGKGTIFNEKAGTGGYKKHLEQKTKENEAYIDSLKPSDSHIKEMKGNVDSTLGAETKKAQENRTNVENSITAKGAEVERLKKEAENPDNKDNREAIEKEMALVQAQLDTERASIDGLKEILHNAKEAQEEALKHVGEEFQRRAESYALSIENPKAAKLAGKKDEADKAVNTKTEEITAKEQEKQKLTESLDKPGVRGTPEEQKISDQIKELDREITKENKNLEGLVKTQTDITKQHTEAMEKGSTSMLQSAKELAAISAGGLLGGIVGLPGGLLGVAAGATVGARTARYAARDVTNMERSKIAEAVKKKPGKKEEKISNKERSKLTKKAKNEDLPMWEREAAAKKAGYDSLKHLLGEADDDDDE